MQEDFGWKLVHGDVFRPPTAIMLLSVLSGTGLQLLMMMFVALVFACIGFLSPPNRGALVTAIVVSVCVMSHVTLFVCDHTFFELVFFCAGVLCIPRLCVWLLFC